VFLHTDQYTKHHKLYSETCFSEHKCENGMYYSIKWNGYVWKRTLPHTGICRMQLYQGRSPILSPENPGLFTAYPYWEVNEPKGTIIIQSRQTTLVIFDNKEFVWFYLIRIRAATECSACK